VLRIPHDMVAAAGYVLEAGPGQIDAYRSAQAAGRELAAEEALRLALGGVLA
jgi:hypothetical protein